MVGYLSQLVAQGFTVEHSRKLLKVSEAYSFQDVQDAYWRMSKEQRQSPDICNAYYVLKNLINKPMPQTSAHPKIIVQERTPSIAPKQKRKQRSNGELRGKILAVFVEMEQRKISKDHIITTVMKDFSITKPNAEYYWYRVYKKG